MPNNANDYINVTYINHIHNLRELGIITENEFNLLHSLYKKSHKEDDMQDNEHKHDENLKPCAHCGEVHDRDDLVEVKTYNGTELWCPECVDLHTETCDRCGEIVARDDLTNVNTWRGEQDWCLDCVAEHTSTCDHCGEVWSDDETICEVCVRHAGWRNGRWCEAQYEQWCENCCDYDADVCEDCGQWFAEGLVNDIDLYDGTTRSVCDPCLSDNYRECYDCERYVPSDEVEWDRWDDPYCPNCIERHISPIDSYHHTSGDHFWVAPNEGYLRWNLPARFANIPFMGVELEVDDVNDRDDCARDIVNEYDETYLQLKEDGSLSEDGFEIVSQPMTIETHLELGMWERVSGLVRNYGGTSHEAGTCGFHIHVSRKSLTDDTVYRLDRLFHRFAPQMQRFARRTSGQMHWCRITEDTLKNIPDVENRKKEWKKIKGWSDRYEAVNNTNCGTVEIRLWRGTLNVETIRATLEFTWALFDICNKMPDEFADQLTWSMVKVLVRFALEEAGLPHDDFDNYITRRGL